MSWNAMQEEYEDVDRHERTSTYLGRRQTFKFGDRAEGVTRMDSLTQLATRTMAN